MPILWEVTAGVGVARINRPERRNALNADLCRDLLSLLRDHPDLRAVVIGGTGDRAFCAGADLGRRAADTKPADTEAADTEAGQLEHGGGDTFRPAFEELLDAIVAYPTPVIAAVNGAALGAGMQLAVACDLRVVASTVTFGIPAGRLGVVISAANVRRLVLTVGQPTARDVLLTARTLDVDEAERVGLVQRRAADAVAGATELAEEVARLAPLSVEGHKRALNVVAATSTIPDAGLEQLGRRESEAFASRDLQEGLAAFSEKRAPTFDGR
ncbi:MAG: enoyl-CoA hydratase-related protein [Acidimicrobiia bacterium]|nr:enoyl-CoA hydratase-related protein [Acidimicrobiia bacterium]